MLNPDGIIYLVTPNISGLIPFILRSKWWGLRPSHLYYFSNKTIINLLKKSGFEVIYINSFGRIFTYKYWLSRLINYNKIFYKAIRLIINMFNAGDKFVYINTRDSVEVIAKKK